MVVETTRNEVRVVEHITYNKKSSKDLGLILTNDIVHELSSEDISTVVIAGRDGELLVDNQRLNTVNYSFPFVLKTTDMVRSIEDISQWLSPKGWNDLELSWDSHYVYRATHYTQVSLNEVVRTFGRLLVTFKVHPIKYHREGLKRIKLTKGQRLLNLGNQVAKPVITITGNGNVDLRINGRLTRLVNIQGVLTLDMVNNLVRGRNLAEWDKVVRSPHTVMPSLDLGENVITWTGNCEVYIEPRWGVRI